MAEEVSAAGIFELRAEGGDFRAEIADLTEVAKRFERATVEAFNRAGKAASDTAALEASSKRYVSAIEREALGIERKTAALVLSATKMREAEAAGRGETANAAAAIGRLEAAEAAYKSLAAQMQQMRDINIFGEMLSKAQALGQVEKNIDSLTAALDRLQSEARDAGSVRLTSARGQEALTRIDASAIASKRSSDDDRAVIQTTQYIVALEDEIERLAVAEKNLKAVEAFDKLLAESQALGEVTKRTASLTAALDKLSGKARETADTRLFAALHQESADMAQMQAGIAAYEAAIKRVKAIGAFDELLASSAALGQVGKNIDNITAALDRLDGEAKSIGQTKVFEARVAEAAKLGMAEQYMASYARAGNSMVAAERAFAADRSFVDSLKKRSDAIGKTQADLLELEAAERGVSQQAAPYIANLRAQERALGIYSTGARDARVSTNQLRTAMQQLPAQFTDVFTSLAGGQNPLLVLIQQGGQIKDSFGGVGNALNALKSILTPVRLLVGGLAAAVGVAGLAYKQASDETDAYGRAVVLSGNAAGTTVGKLQAMAAAVSALGGTQGKAAEVLTQLAGSGKVAAAQFAQLTAAAIALERAGGPAAKETADAFIELGRAPSAAALKLTEQTGFLTAELYKQITALERQGRTSDAAALAQNAAAQSTADQARKLEAGLGTLQKAWRGFTDAAKEAWDAALGVGRPETTISRLDDAAAAFAKANRLKRLPAFGSSPMANQSTAQQQYQGANAAAGYEAVNAAYEKLRAEANKAGIEIEKLAESLKMPGAVLSDQQKQIKAWGDAWIESAKDPAEAAQRAKEVGELSARAYSMSAQAAINYGNVQARIAAAASRDAQRVASELSDLQHQREMGLRSEYEGIKAIADAQVRASKAEEDRIRQSLANVSQLPAERQQQERIKLEADLAVKRQQTAQITVDANNQIAAAIYKRALAAEAATRAESDLLAIEQANGDKAIGDRYKAIAEATQDYAQSLQDAAYAMQIEAAAAVLPEQQREVMLKQLQNELALRKRLREINEAPGLSPDQRDILRSQAAQAGSAANQLAVDQVAAEHSARLWKRIGEDISNTLTDAIIDGGEGGAKALQDLFKRLVLRPVIQAGVNQLIGAAGNYAGAAVNAATGSNWFQKAGQAGGAVNGAQTAYNVYGAYAPAANYAAVYSGQAYGTGFATQQSSMLAAQEAGMVSNAGGSAASGASSSAGVYALYAAIAIKSYQQAQKDYREGFRKEQSEEAMDEFPVLRPIFGLQSIVDSIFRELGMSDRSAAVWSGSTQAARLFGQAPFKLEETGITGTLGQGGFAGEQYSRFKSKGGFFRDDDFQTFTSSVSDALQNTLSTASATVYTQAIEFGKALGLPADQLGAVSKQIKVVLTSENITELSKKYGEDLSKPFEELSDEGKRIAQTSEFSDAVKKDFEARMGAIGDALGAYGDELVKGYAAALGPLATYGETTVETLMRVGGSLIGVNEVLETLGVTALQASIDGGKAALSLLSMFGDLGDLQQAAGGYLRDYYTDSERAALTTKALSKTLAEVGLALPDSAAGFRDLVEAQDLSTEAGRKAFGILMSTAGAFASIVPSAEKAAEAARELSGDLQVAIAQTLEKLGRSDSYSGIQADLAGAGASLTLGQLMGASKDDIYEFTRSFVTLSGATDEAKIAVVTAAGALADLRGKADDLGLELLRATGQEQAAVNIERQAELEALGRLNPAMASVKKLIYEATDAAAMWSRQLQLLTGVDSIAPDFMSGGELATYRAERIRQTLAAGGIDASVTAILGSTREDVLALWHAVGVDGKEAVLEAYGAWKQLNDEMRAAPIQKQLDDLTKKFGDLSFLDPKPLSAVYSENLAELDSLQKGLDTILGRTVKTVQEALSDMIADQKALQTYRAGLADDIFGARLRGMQPADRVTALKGREAQLFGQLGSAKDPVAVAQQLQGVIVSRIKEEADLRRVSSDAQIEALREQISGAERLQRMSEQIGQFTGSMRFSDLSPLGFEDQLSAARSLYETTVAKARGGDETAMGALTGNAQAYLQEARSFFASSEGFAGVFNSVLGELDALGAVDPGLKAAQDQLTALEKISASQEALSEDVIWASDQEVAALMQIDTALASREAANQGKIDAQIKLAQAQVDELKTLVADQKAQLVQQAAIAKALTAELIKLNGTAAETATEASLAGATP